VAKSKKCKHDGTCIAECWLALCKSFKWKNQIS